MKVKESKLWILFIVAGALIVALLGIHMIIMHCDSLVASVTGGVPHDVLGSESVAQRSKSAVHMVIYIALLLLALFHGFYGLRSMVQELPVPDKLRGYVDAFSVSAGFVLFIWGTTAVLIGFLK
jgi:succinate dehydrogenase hydrophobic anchor subunit